MLFASGCYFEAMGSPRVRPLVDSPLLPTGVHVSAPSARESWRRAEEYFRRAIEIDPSFAPARVRRARVLDMLGRYEEAVREVREAVTRTTDPALLYYAAMFDGAAREGLGDAAAARASYERAAATFPHAQSPYLALSHLARERGDRVAALAAMQQVFSGRARTETDEPLWAYYSWFIRNAEDLFVQLRQPFGPSGADSAKEPGADSGTWRDAHR
jgi:tetratricopeptide (TPR) repeat protein